MNLRPLLFACLIPASVIFASCLRPTPDARLVRPAPSMPSSPASPTPPASTAAFACRAFSVESRPIDFGYPSNEGAVTRFEGSSRIFRSELENLSGRIQLTLWFRDVASEPYERFVWSNLFPLREQIDFAFSDHVVVGTDHPSPGTNLWRIRCDHADLLPTTLSL